MEQMSGFTPVAVILVLLGVLWITLIVVALIQIAQTTELGAAMKLVWAVIVFFFPFLGTLAWFIVGRRIGDPFRS